MRVLGAAPRIPSPGEPVPVPRRLSGLGDCTTSIKQKPIAYFNTWRARNADDEDERIALADWLPSPSPADILAPAPCSTTEPWVTAFILVTFDNDRGQTVQHAVPQDVLTTAELDTIAFHALPDSASVSNPAEDALFSFRIPRRIYPSGNDCGLTSVASTRLLLAHTLFRQTPDATQPRGFFQQSLVVVTSTPYLGLPAVMLSILAPKAFVHGRPALQQAVRDLSEWPDPRGDFLSNELILPFVGDGIMLNIPRSFLLSFAAPVASCHKRSLASEGQLYESPISNASSCSSPLLPVDDKDPWDVSASPKAAAITPPIARRWALCAPCDNWSVPIFDEVNPVVALAGVTEHLPTLWEIIVVGEPLLVCAQTPTESSAAVMALLGLIHPLPFIGDWRPYFCIQDPDYERVADAASVRDLFPEGAVFGVTNKHVVETLGFPHVLHLPYVRRDGKRVRGRLVTSVRTCVQRSRSLRQAAARALTAHNRRGFHEATVQVYAFRACVMEKLTEPFLRAFDRYLSPVRDVEDGNCDNDYSADPFDRALKLTTLDMLTFPTAEDISAPSVTALFRRGNASRMRVRLLYERFVQGPVFREWWHEVRSSAERGCSTVHRTELLDACVRLSEKMAGHRIADVGETGYEGVELKMDMARRVRAELWKSNYEDELLRESLQNLLTNLTVSLPWSDSADSPPQTC